MHGDLRVVPPGPLPPLVLRPLGPTGQVPLDTCFHCHSLVAFVRVAGHLQCPRCRQVSETCCEGITMSHDVETGKKL